MHLPAHFPAPALLRDARDAGDALGAAEPHGRTRRPPRVIYLHALAPAKPPTGLPCNGCGLCCAVEPCPLGMLLSRRIKGACSALSWSAPERRYVCGALAQPTQWLPWLPKAWAERLVRRWIAAGTACDAELGAV
jgi:hypothetical protein